VVAHVEGVAVKGVAHTKTVARSPGQRVVASTGVVENVEGVAVEDVGRIIYTEQRVVSALLMVRERPGLGIWDRLWHGTASLSSSVALRAMKRVATINNCQRLYYRILRQVAKVDMR
jgi:hypothetical protein